MGGMMPSEAGCGNRAGAWGSGEPLGGLRECGRRDVLLGRDDWADLFREGASEGCPRRKQ